MPSTSRVYYFYISQHAIYINKLEKAISNHVSFEHKTCRECNFGRRFYSEIYPHIETYPEELTSLIREIERLHCEFHEVASAINTLEPKEEDKEKLKRAEDISNKLFQKLLILKNLIKRAT